VLFRSKGASRDMYLRDGALVPGLSTDGALSVAVPGAVAGYLELLAKHGKLKPAVVLAPAIRLVDELPLISQPVNNAGRALARPAAAPVILSKSKPQRVTPAASSASSAEASDSTAVREQLMQWGRSTARTAWQEAQALVRITRIRQPDAILITPDQTFFLRENLKLRLLNARLALLSRQTASAVADLQVAQAALDKYFDTQSRKTQLLQSLLADVSAQSPQTQVPRPDDTLASLAALAGGR